jgi:hypothetical protein
MYSSEEIAQAIIIALILEVPPGTEKPELFVQLVPASPNEPNWKLTESSGLGYPYPDVLAKVVARIQATHRMKTSRMGGSTF